MYYLVLLQPGEASSGPRLDTEHEVFIDDLIRRNQILLGGNLLPRSDLPAGYLLACGSQEQAQELVEGDPYVREASFVRESSNGSSSPLIQRRWSQDSSSAPQTRTRWQSAVSDDISATDGLPQSSPAPRKL